MKRLLCIAIAAFSRNVIRAGLNVPTFPAALGLRLVALAFLGIGLTAASAAEPDEGPSPAELARDYQRLKQARYYRHGSSVYENVLRFAQMDESRTSLADRFTRAYYESRWDDVREMLEKMPDDTSGPLYDRIIEDLTGRNIPVISLDDVIGLADACPGEWRTSRVRGLGQLMRVAVPREQEIWLRKAIDKGSRRLGRDDDKRLATGRILLHANFAELARELLPGPVEASQIADAEVRNELLTFLATRDEIEELEQTQLTNLWKQKADVLANAQAPSNERQQAADRLAELMGRAPAGALDPWINDLMRDDLTAGLWLATALGKTAQGRANDPDIAIRTNNLRAQKTLLIAAAKHADLAKAPWAQVAAAMTDWWIREVDHAFEEHPTRRQARQAKGNVAPGDLLATAPDGVWVAALPPSLRERVDMGLSRAVLVSDRIDQAVDLIVDIAKRNRAAGIELAQEYLEQWAFRHNPEISEEIRKKHSLPDDARIIVTPIMMEKNIEGLAGMMNRFRKHDIEPKNGEALVAAFDVCYSRAEVYRREHIEKVFGPVVEMDEDVFLHMIRTMVAGLSTHWRKIDVQTESGTRRTQEETLRMVREGYRTAVEMIDQRAAKQPDGWRNLMLAGSLLSDWADFEYYQDLAAEAQASRMELFREKNNRAEEFFVRATDAYARQVPTTDRGRYSIDAYLAWFHSLLGINTNGDLNASKPLDRRALNLLREQMRKLPAEAAKLHIDRFARHVTARMEDVETPLHEDVKYKYLAGSLVLTRESPFAFQADSKVNYYDELLGELRLESRVDGPTTVHRDQHFGIILTVHHTEAVGRMAEFGKYLVNETPPPPQPWVKKPAGPTINVYRTGISRGRRDDLERSIREAFSLFFDIKSITFSPRDVEARSTDRPGWKETVLAYVYAKPKDASVDKIPRVQMSLAFLDLSGPVKITIESPEAMIKVTDQKTPPRPFHRLDVTQVFDARNAAQSEEALLEISASANGLVPELDELFDLTALGAQRPIARIDPHDGVTIRELNSWTGEIHAVSERRWTVALGVGDLLSEGRQMELALPTLSASDSAAKYQTYADMDLLDLDKPVVLVGAANGETVSAASDRPWTLYAALGGAAAVALLALVAAVAWPRGGPRPVRARDVFHMPAAVDGFVVVQLLRRLADSELARLSDPQRREMRAEIDRIERTCFQNNGSGLSEEQLRGVCQKWLRLAC
jgi:hypothetical protein